MQNVREYLSNVYLDMVNNYLTVTKWAEHNGLTEAQATALLQVAKDVFNSKHPEA